MLGVLHRTVLGKGPTHLRKHFKREAGWKLEDPRTYIKDPLVVRSALGLTVVYNMLPERCRAANSVKEFQTGLQKLVKDRLEDGYEDWGDTLSPRTPMGRHPLAGICKCIEG